MNIEKEIIDSVRGSVCNSVWNSASNSVRDSMERSVSNSVWDSMRGSVDIDRSLTDTVNNSINEYEY